jgi:hypothetical protein
VKGSSEGDDEVRTAVKGIEVLIRSPRLKRHATEQLSVPGFNSVIVRITHFT